MAQAYSDLKDEPRANLATAERFYTIGALPQAAVFAGRARQALAKGSPDWERANDILTVASAQMKQNRN
jgi:predicted Zn-dependent protease